MRQEQPSPRHIAIIMDGNGRWAASRGLPRVLGHQAGADAVRRIVEASCELGIETLTLYAFSWENRNRPPDEVRDLMQLLDVFLSRETSTLMSQQIRLRAIGRLEELPVGVWDHLRYVMAQTAPFKRMTLNLALSYGGRQEIVDAARRLCEKVCAGQLRVDQIDEACFAQQLYAPDLCDPDLLVRTSGEQRLSNFLLWQSSYTELYVTSKLWPDFSKADLMEAISEYQRRDRRFGGHTPASSPRSAPSVVLHVTAADGHPC
ncbi:MAG: di-trans,poly-cis-decaprenylcistransferase [Candidatus Omnitrophica bacterium]|nr:di-trans,poly-cis-decaprenylcistransferase [Candidatus Omnitrophota bacterium]MBI2174350.1 di-trans,poly-cis-decaprenylcistransferase [Candidatus Omnitrophota bacterium]